MSKAKNTTEILKRLRACFSNVELVDQPIDGYIVPYQDHHQVGKARGEGGSVKRAPFRANTWLRAIRESNTSADSLDQQERRKTIKYIIINYLI